MSTPPRWDRALVTGASSGIGTAVARRLAADGTHLVLVARDLPRLDRLAIELRQRHRVEVEVLVADLADDAATAVACRRLAAADAPVDLLVANAGFGTGGRFHELPLDREEAEIRVNLLAPVRLTHAALGAMVPRGRGTVVFVSSLAGLVPAPRSATYAATKAYLNSFGESLHEELKGTGVGCTVVLPGFTRTEFQTRAGVEASTSRVPDRAWMTADAVAGAALASAARGEGWCIPGGGYRALATLADLTPRPVLRRIAAVLRRDV